ncbi:hypothetical protein GPROT2_01926 [Gammaproteobacteria bacterium]|nr:hypothetical protein [Gammaproteobacteria bacterium]CAG0942941.1 hypothetical protein GPROT2_01926 [Gammaproteobacteria bacterium]
MNGFLEAITVGAEARREGLLFALALGAACGVAITSAGLDPMMQAGIAAALLLRLAIGLWRLSPRHPAYVIRVTWLPGGRWRLDTGAGTVGAQLLHAWGRSLGPVIALEWLCDDGCRRQAWLWRHRCARLHWRRLRAHLRLA